jgi:hypothetical protein
VLLNVSPGFATGCFEGSIYEKETGPVIEGVNVILINFYNNETVIETVKTSSEGYYRACFQQGGLKNLFVWAPDFSPERRSLEATDSNQKIDFELVKSGSLKGSILNASNLPIEGATIHFEYLENIDFPFIPEITAGVLVSKNDGLFVVKNIEANRSARISVTHPDYESYTSPTYTLNADEEVVLNIILISKTSKNL